MFHPPHQLTKISILFRPIESNLEVVGPYSTKLQLGIRGAVGPPVCPGESPDGALGGEPLKDPRISYNRTLETVLSRAIFLVIRYQVETCKITKLIFKINHIETVEE